MLLGNVFHNLWAAYKKQLSQAFLEVNIATVLYIIKFLTS